MKVLCSTPSSEGAFGPFIPLGQAFRDAGHEVLVVTGPDLIERAAHAGFATTCAGPSMLEAALAAMDDPAVGAARDGEHWHFAGALFGACIAPAKLPGLREAADTFAPDLIVHPPVDLAGPLLAVERDVPSVTYGFGQPLQSEIVRTLADRVAPLWREAGRAPDSSAGIYRDCYLDPRPPSLRHGPPLEAVDVLAMRQAPAGDPNAPAPGWASDLGTRPAVFISLGTVPFFNQPETFRVLLEDLASEDLELIVAVGELNDPSALGPQPEHVHIEQWLSLAAILPRCDAVICHAGSGTTLAALACGLPLVLVPQGADQFSNADACAAGGVAQVIRPGERTGGAVCEATLAILAPDAPERVAARRAGREIADLPGAASVVTDLVARLGH